MTQSRRAELAKAGYRAYGDSTRWKNYAGLPMPAWEDLGERIQQAWMAAAGAIARAAVESAALIPPGGSGTVSAG